MAAMLIHAAGESSKGNLPPETRAVALQADQAQLDTLVSKLERANIVYHKIEEDGKLLAIGIAPIEDVDLKTVRRATGSLRLVR